MIVSDKNLIHINIFEERNVLPHIFKFLHKDDFHCLSLVNKLFFQICNDMAAFQTIFDHVLNGESSIANNILLKVPEEKKGALKKARDILTVWKKLAEGNRASVPEALLQNEMEERFCAIFASPTKTRNLDLSDLNLTYLPPEIFKLIQVKRLNLSKNPIQYISSSINKMISLSFLNLSQINLKKIPEELGDLTNLQKLDLSKNELANGSIPPGLFQKLQNLQHLILDEEYSSSGEFDFTPNPLSYLPEEIQLELVKLPKMKVCKLDFVDPRRLLPIFRDWAPYSNHVSSMWRRFPVFLQ